jgi:hypothetical protein
MFGFIDVTIKIPKDCLKPMLPYRHEGKLIFPSGIIRLATYFIEEIKAVVKYNTIEILIIHKY